MSDLKNTPVCPHCNYEFDVEETWHSTYSEESRVMTEEDESGFVRCHNDDCKALFEVTCVSVLMFSSEEIED